MGLEKGRRYGYARVSSKEQNLDRQILALSEYVSTENILTDKASGKDLNRPAYQALKSPLGLRRGDELYMYHLTGCQETKLISSRSLSGFGTMGSG